jgi:hypothetical protein
VLIGIFIGMGSGASAGAGGASGMQDTAGRFLLDTAGRFLADTTQRGIYTPALDFSDVRNTQYVILVF